LLCGPNNKGIDVARNTEGEIGLAESQAKKQE